MADDADRAQERDEILGKYLVGMSRKPSGPPFTGRCHFCDTPVEAPRRWCDPDCARDYQYEIERRRVNTPI